MVSGPGHELLLTHPFLLTDKGPWVRQSSQRLCAVLLWQLSGPIQPQSLECLVAPLAVEDLGQARPSPSSGPKGPLPVVMCSPAHNIPPSTGIRGSWCLLSIYYMLELC